jgi:hypothetical protein
MPNIFANSIGEAHQNLLSNYTITVNSTNKRACVNGKASGDAVEPLKSQETTFDLGLETDQDNDTIPSIHKLGYGLSLTTISVPFTQFKIKAAINYISKSVRKWRINSFPRTGHHFWLLVRIHNGQEIALEAIHGLSTFYKRDLDGNTQAHIPSQGLQTWNSKLQVYCVLPSKVDSIEPFISWIEPDETYTQHYDKPSKNYVIDLWDQVRHSIKDLNKAEVSYSFCGIGKSLGLKSKNSNSAYSSIAYIMGVEPHRFQGVLAPGCNTTMLKRRDLASRSKQFNL